MNDISTAEADGVFRAAGEPVAHFLSAPTIFGDLGSAPGCAPMRSALMPKRE